MAAPNGSATTAASAVYPASSVCRVPLPEHSSSTTDSRWIGAPGERPSRRSARTAPKIAASPHFMSAEPRPKTQPSSWSPPNGSRSPHWLSGSGLTTSMWPFRIRDRPPFTEAPSAGSHVVTTFALPSVSQSKGDARG